MGWTTCYNAKHWKSVNGRMVVDRKKCVDDLHTFQEKTNDGKIISSTRVLKSTMHGSVWYGACETVRDGKATVWASVCLTQGKSSYDGTIWGYKPISEDMGPFYYDCPSTILRLLTEPKTETAAQWRKACDERRAEKKVQKAVAIPTGISITYRGGWIVSSPEYRATHYYPSVRYIRAGKMNALDRFIESFGTEAQKTEWVSKKVA